MSRTRRGEELKQMGLALPLSLKEAVEAAAKANGRTVAEEIRSRLGVTLGLAGSLQITQLANEMAGLIAKCEEATGSMLALDPATARLADLAISRRMARYGSSPDLKLEDLQPGGLVPPGTDMQTAAAIIEAASWAVTAEQRQRNAQFVRECEEMETTAARGLQAVDRLQQRSEALREGKTDAEKGKPRRRVNR